MERNNRKSDSTIFYLTLTHVQQGTKRKSTVSLVKKKLCLINSRIYGLEGGGHHPVTVLLATVEYFGIEDHLIYQIHQKSYIDL